MRIAVVDDDPAEHLILRELGASVRAEARFEGFLSMQDFINAGPEGFDIVFLDRRLPPYERYCETLPALADTAFDGRVVLMTAAAPQSAMDSFRFPISGPVDKLALLDPECLAAYLDDTPCDCTISERR